MNPQFLTDLGQNRILACINGKTILLRCRTVHQMEQYRRWVEARRAEEAKVEQARTEAPDQIEAPPADPLAQMQENIDRYADWCEMALNPTPDKHEWSKDRIKTALDADQIELLALVWFDRFTVPRKEADPSLMAPRSR